MELSVKSEGIGLFLECIEIDENDSQSMRFKVKLDLEHPTGTFTYSADDIWLETDMWDCFEQSLNKGLEEKAVFRDQSSYFEIALTKGIRDIEFTFKVREPLVGSGETSFLSSRKFDLDSGFINTLRDNFSECPKIW